MTILEKVEVYGKYFMELATDEEVAEYWDMVDGVWAQREQDVLDARILEAEYSMP